MIQHATASEIPPGMLEDDVYKRRLSPSRHSIRRWMMKLKATESSDIAGWQTRFRSPFLDSWFHASSVLGATSFFIATIPLFFLFGDPSTGRSLLYVLGWGNYLSSLLKDYLCIPRPASPPVTRLTISLHHLEYGMPSTHTTNSVSAAIFMLVLVARSSLSTFSKLVMDLGIALYVGSVVGGRIYCGMHGVSDCVVGILIGTFTVLMNMAFGEAWERIMEMNSVIVPLFILLLVERLIHHHPSTVEPCLCFEDALSGLSSMAGVSVGRWALVNLNLPPATASLSLSQRFSAESSIIVSTLIGLVHVVLTVAALMTYRVAIKSILATPLKRMFSAAPKAKDNAHMYRYPTHEVILKVIVYGGIGWLGSEALPWVFRWLG
ncbi:PAP2-domain-containing protein [Clavulina sp. PMI_390]|nr:PAP2-domain-containing protein [Clavulina sp. PMI_390]